MAKTPSPCIDVCKFKRDGHCIGCSMTKEQKKISKRLKKDSQREAFVALVMAQQQVMGRYSHWEPAYRKRLRKKGVRLQLISSRSVA